MFAGDAGLDRQGGLRPDGHDAVPGERHRRRGRGPAAVRRARRRVLPGGGERVRRGRDRRARRPPGVRRPARAGRHRRAGRRRG